MTRPAPRAMPRPVPRPDVCDPGLTRPDWTRDGRRDPRLLWLDKNENTDPALAEAVRSVVAGLATEPQYTYPEAAPTYAKLAAMLGLGPDSLLFGHGSDGLIRATFEAFVSPGDRIVHTAPTFAMYGVYAKMFGARPVPLAYRPSDDGPRLTVDEVIGAIRTHRPRAVFLPNPDSPTGTVFDPDGMRAIIAAAGDAGAVILVDEAYYPFHPLSVLPWVGAFPHLFVTRSTGKAWGLAGFRIGYGAADPHLARILHKVKGMYEINTFGLAVFDRMLDRLDAVEASVARLQAGKAAFLDAMDGLGYRTLRGAGNFCHVAFGAKAEKVHDALADLVYYRKDFSEPCLSGFSRFSATTPERFGPLIARIRAASA